MRLPFPVLNLFSELQEACRLEARPGVDLEAVGMSEREVFEALRETWFVLDLLSEGIFVSTGRERDSFANHQS